jgi:TetR/AcrR family transcriptional regulator
VAAEPIGEIREWDGRRWELRAALRAARRARAEAGPNRRRDPATALVDAARELSLEGGGQFTVKQVAERAGVALQTVYRHFGSKDELLLAVIEEDVISGCEEMAAAAARTRGPTAQLRAIVRAPLVMLATSEAHQRMRFHARVRQHLAEQYPQQMEEALAPYRALLLVHLRRVADHDGLDHERLERDAEVIQQLVMAYAHALGSGMVTRAPSDAADLVWDFCHAALLRASQ